MGKQGVLVGRVGRTFPKSEDSGGVEGALDPQRKFYSALDGRGKHVEIPCPNAHCKKPVCLADRAECTHSGEEFV